MSRVYRLISGVDTLDEEREQAAISGLSIAGDRRLAARVVGSIWVYFEKWREAEAIAEERVTAIRGWVEHQKLIYQKLRDGLEEYLKTCEGTKVVSDIGQAYLSNNPDELIIEGTDKELIECLERLGWNECITKQVCRSALRKRLEGEPGQKEIYDSDPLICCSNSKRLAYLKPQEPSLRIRWNE